MSALFLLCAAVCSRPSWLGLPAPESLKRNTDQIPPLALLLGHQSRSESVPQDWIAAGLHNRPRRLWEFFPGFPV